MEIPGCNHLFLCSKEVAVGDVLLKATGAGGERILERLKLDGAGYHVHKPCMFLSREAKAGSGGGGRGASRG